MMLVSLFNHDAIEADMEWGDRGQIPIERNVRLHTHAALWSSLACRYGEDAATDSPLGQG